SKTPSVPPTSRGSESERMPMNPNLPAPFRFCRLPERLDGSFCRWAGRQIAWTITDLVPGIGEGEMRSLCTQAFGLGQAEADIEIAYTDNARTAQILIGSRWIDGPNVILAETELPCGNPDQIHMWFDTGDTWKTGDDQTHAIIFFLVALHEAGHALGL